VNSNVRLHKQSMPPALKVLASLALATAATIATSAVPRLVTVTYPGTMDCQHGCNFVAGGWPFPYLIDHPGISPTGSVSLANGLLGVDIIWPGHLFATFVFWLMLFAAIGALAGRARQRIARGRAT
jgi:hypothetical protein